MKRQNKSLFGIIAFSVILMIITVFLDGKHVQDQTKAMRENNKTLQEEKSETTERREFFAYQEENTTTKEAVTSQEEKKNKETNVNLVANEASIVEVSKVPYAVLRKEPIVYDGLTLRQLADKLNRSLASTLSGYGEMIGNYSLQVGVDPYMAVAIMLHETGCSYSCSSLVTQCNNVGGQKGGPSCGGGAYKAYPTLEEGIRGFLDNLANNYIANGLTTPETIGPKYAASTVWSSKILNYMDKIRSA